LVACFDDIGGLFWWYWWIVLMILVDCWPSLFKFSFYNICICNENL
jgi:hypothetical protein